MFCSFIFLQCYKCEEKHDKIDCFEGKNRITDFNRTLIFKTGFIMKIDSKFFSQPQDFIIIKWYVQMTNGIVKYPVSSRKKLWIQKILSLVGSYECSALFRKALSNIKSSVTRFFCCQNTSTLTLASWKFW